MPLRPARAARRGVIGAPVARTAALVGTTAVVAHGVGRRHDATTGATTAETDATTGATAAERGRGSGLTRNWAVSRTSRLPMSVPSMVSDGTCPGGFVECREHLCPGRSGAGA